MRRQAWLIAVAGLLVVLILAVVARNRDGDSVPDDPRAYPADDGRTSLAQALRRAGVTLPDCVAEDLRYAALADDLYLQLAGPAPCMNRFLTLNDLSDSVEVEDAPDADLPAWTGAPPVPDLGWQLPASLAHARFTAVTANGYDIDALVRELTDQSAYRAYVRVTKPE